MQVVFLGTPGFAVPTLERLAQAGHQILAAYTQPDRPKGRGGNVAACPVKLAAQGLGIPVRQPERINRPEVVEELAALGAEAMVIVGYGQIIPQSVIDLAPLGIINVHASLLPKYRGAAPIQWAIASGETATGVTTMKIDAGLDTGDILLQQETPILPEETAVELGDRLSLLGADLLLETIQGIERGVIVPKKQDPAFATHAPVLRKEDGLIDWGRPASEICNKVRGFVPWPGAWTYFRGRLLHVSRARVSSRPANRSAGLLLPWKKSLLAECGGGTCLELVEIQLEGRKTVTGEAFMNGQRLGENERLGEMAK